MRMIFLLLFLLFSFFIIHFSKKLYNSFFLQKEKISKEIHNVSAIVDGDTFIIENLEKIRLIGVDAPEKNEKCYEDAKQRLRELIENKTIIIEKDKKERDKYNRLLGYVFVNDTFVNLLLVKEGLAYVYIDLENTRYLKELLDAQKYAKENKIGCLWKD